jgi:Tol biopolymer transport system component
MPTHVKPKLLLPALLLAALLAFPVVAEATVTYVRNPLDSQVYVAGDDGSGARKIGPGRTPHVSPDGATVAYLSEGPRHTEELKLAPVAGGPIRTLMSGWRESSSLAWSPDSQKILALRGPEIGKRKLVLLDVASGAQRVVARGYFSGFSFSPDGNAFVYARAGSEKFPPRSDVFRAATSGGTPTAITRDHRSSSPLWGPEAIVFVKTVEGKKRRYGPKNELFLMNPQGRALRRLTHTKVPPLLQGLFPTDWSADGSRLLTEFEGQDTSYAVVVNARTGAQRPVAEKGEAGFVGAALSADGEFVLGSTGGFDPSARHDVATVPYGGGRPKVLVRNALEPDWSR